jgi:hypothetical protein
MDVYTYLFDNGNLAAFYHIVVIITITERFLSITSHDAAPFA